MSYERQDASLRVIGIASALLTFGLAVTLGASAWWYHAQHDGAKIGATALRSTSFTQGSSAGPDIRRDWRKVNSAARERLAGYAWVDRDAGVARIPIERAMALVVQNVKPAPAPKEPGHVP